MFPPLFALIFCCGAENKLFLVYLGQIDANLNIKDIDASTATSNYAIWDEFSEQYQHHIASKASCLMPNYNFF